MKEQTDDACVHRLLMANPNNLKYVQTEEQDFLRSKKEVLNHLKLKREITKNVRNQTVKIVYHVKRHKTIMKTISEGKVEGK